MKLNKYIYITFLAIIFTAISCDRNSPSFSSEMLIGKWKRVSRSASGQTGYDCYRYDMGGNGVTWDTSEDVNESEGQPFQWTFNEDRLRIVHIGEMGQKIYKIYIVKVLNANALSYINEYGDTFTFTKFTGQP